MIFKCRDVDNYGPDEWVAIDAFDAESAACEAAERFDNDNAEYPDEQQVEVDSVGTFTVQGEVSRIYSATRQDDAEEETP